VCAFSADIAVGRSKKKRWIRRTLSSVDMLLFRSFPLKASSSSGGTYLLTILLVLVTFVSTICAEDDANEELQGILLPPEDKYNFVGEDDPTTTTTLSATKSESPSLSSSYEWRKSRGDLPQSIQISSNGFKIRDGSSSSSSSQR